MFSFDHREEICIRKTSRRSEVTCARRCFWVSSRSRGVSGSVQGHKVDEVILRLTHTLGKEVDESVKQLCPPHEMFGDVRIWNYIQRSRCLFHLVQHNKIQKLPWQENLQETQAEGHVKNLTISYSFRVPNINVSKACTTDCVQLNVSDLTRKVFKKWDGFKM